jgi:hypothetical protein
MLHLRVVAAAPASWSLPLWTTSRTRRSADKDVPGIGGRVLLIENQVLPNRKSRGTAQKNLRGSLEINTTNGRISRAEKGRQVIRAAAPVTIGAHADQRSRIPTTVPRRGNNFRLVWASTAQRYIAAAYCYLAIDGVGSRI